MPTPALFKAIRFVEGLRELEDGPNIHASLIVLHVAAKPGITQAEIVRLTGIGQSKMSRAVERLSDMGGSGLIAARRNLLKRSLVNLTLTARGDEVVRNLLRFV